MALATQLLASGRGVSGSAYLIEGLSSAGDAMFASDRSYQSGINILNRDGVISTRPAFRAMLTLPSGKLQNLTWFRPLDSVPQLCFVIDGKAYVSEYPFVSYAQIPDIQLYWNAPQVFAEAAVQSSVLNADGSITATEPKKMLIFQDGGLTRAAFWSVSGSGHIDPTNGGIPLGGPMKWSGDRLWVAQKNKLFAGDISNPLSFTENLYAAEGGFFQFDEDLTALGETLDQSGSPTLLAFTARTTSALKSSIRDRESWKVTPNFQSTLFPEVGCVSARSVISHYGLTWWMTETGLTNLSKAAQSSVSSKIIPQDVAFREVKQRLNSNLGYACAGAHENFLLFGVPYASLTNSHTWVRDQAVIADGNNTQEAWAGIWKGIEPVQFAGGSYLGNHRLFAVAKDTDGVNRLWEMFSTSRAENESGIISVLETKTHIDFSDKASGLDRKRFLFAELHFTDVKEETTVELMWKGTRGVYKSAGTWVFAPTQDEVHDTVRIQDTKLFDGLRSQARIVRSPNVPQAEVASAESAFGDWVDIGFSLCIRWTGRASLRTYRIFVDPKQESGDGDQAFTEVTASSLEAGFLPAEVGYFSIPEGTSAPLATFGSETITTFNGTTITTF